MTELEPSKEYLEGLFNGQSLIISDAIENMLTITEYDLDKIVNELLEHLFRTCMRSETGDYQNIIGFINEYNKDRKEVKE